MLGTVVPVVSNVQMFCAPAMMGAVAKLKNTMTQTTLFILIWKPLESIFVLTLCVLSAARTFFKLFVRMGSVYLVVHLVRGLDWQ